MEIKEKNAEGNLSENLSKLQLALLIVLYGLIALMLIFSINARKNIGKDGFDLCIQKKCQESQEHCSKPREIDNCCMGAGGKFVVTNNGQYTCSFS